MLSWIYDETETFWFDSSDFIMGGYVLSRVLENYSIPNLGKVILDRSPFQEEVSIEAQEAFSKPVVKFLSGQAAVDVGNMNYKHINADTVGLLIETKPGIPCTFPSHATSCT